LAVFFNDPDVKGMARQNCKQAEILGGTRKYKPDPRLNLI